MDYNRSSTDLNATVITASGFVAGAIIPFKTASQNTANGGVAGVFLGAGTYRFVASSPSGDSEVPAQTSILSMQVAWTAAVAGTITVKTCNFPGNLGKFGQGGVDVSDFDTVYWLQQNPTSNVYVPVSGSGNTVTNATVTAGGTAAGLCDFELAYFGARRTCVELALTAGGIVRVNACGKLGS